jgi:hypothetical protein
LRNHLQVVLSAGDLLLDLEGEAATTERASVLRRLLEHARAAQSMVKSVLVSGDGLGAKPRSRRGEE